MDIRGMMRRIARGVADESRGAQRPFTAFYTLSPDPLYLRPALPQLVTQSDVATWTTGSTEDLVEGMELAFDSEASIGDSELGYHAGHGAAEAFLAGK